MDYKEVCDDLELKELEASPAIFCYTRNATHHCEHTKHSHC